MSEFVPELLGEDLPDVERPVVTRVPPTTRDGGDIVYMRPGDHIECECGRAEIKRVADTYQVKGTVYHREGWLRCWNCNDRVRTEPKILFVDGAAPKGLLG